MLENDLMLSTFAAKYLEKFTEKQLDEYDTYVDLKHYTKCSTLHALNVDLKNHKRYEIG